MRIWNFESRLKTDSAEFSSTGTEGVLLEAVLISFLMLERVNGMQAILCAGHFFFFRHGAASLMEGAARRRGLVERFVMFHHVHLVEAAP